MDIFNKLLSVFSDDKNYKVQPLAQSGSNRKYYRFIFSDGRSCIGVFNQNPKENLAFIEFTKHFLHLNLPVPQIIAQDLNNDIYLLSDLGDTTLFSLINEQGRGEDFSETNIELYKQVLTILPKFQITAINDFPFQYCYPRSSFDRQSMLWDLNYFKYYFLKLAKIEFDEQALEDDFKTFIDFLLQADGQYFLYRDFQSRNIMIKDNQPYFIDYQGGRKGALQYDLASLLFDAKADLPNSLRLKLLDFYILQLKNYIIIDEEKFKEHFWGFVLIRIMQALGAYGFRGFYEKKELFQQSIPYALNNIKWLLNNTALPIKLPTLFILLKQLSESEFLYSLGKPKLTVSIYSFSYKKGIPEDANGNGGGFVFDCRALPNPGKYEQYKTLTGKDHAVIQFLEKENEVWEFIHNTQRLVEASIQKYLKREFQHLMVAFGCTGGQHRSVYCAERLAEIINKKYDINVKIKHCEFPNI